MSIAWVAACTLLIVLIIILITINIFMFHILAYILSYACMKESQKFPPYFIYEQKGFSFQDPLPLSVHVHARLDIVADG